MSNCINDALEHTRLASAAVKAAAANTPFIVASVAAAHAALADAQRHLEQLRRIEELSRD